MLRLRRIARKEVSLSFLGRVVSPQLNGDDTLKLQGLYPISTQARGVLGPQRAVKNRELTARPKKEREISFRAILCSLTDFIGSILELDSIKYKVLVNIAY